MILNDYSSEFLESMNDEKFEEFTNSVNSIDENEDFDTVCAQLAYYDSPGGQFSG